MNTDELNETNEFFIDESGASRFGIYVSGPDYYVLSLRQNRAAYGEGVSGLAAQD